MSNQEQNKTVEPASGRESKTRRDYNNLHLKCKGEIGESRLQASTEKSDKALEGTKLNHRHALGMACR